MEPELAAPAEACSVCGRAVRRGRPALTGPFARVLAAIPPFCDECAAEREAALAAAETRERERAAARRAELQAHRWQTESGLPLSHRVELDSLGVPDHVKSAAAEWARNGGGLLLTGDVGRGKTRVAGAACWQRLRHHPVLWCSAPLLFARLGSGATGSDAQRAAARALTTPVDLCLDDVDKVRPTEFGAEHVFLAVDQRVEHERALLVTTNLTPSRLAARWPEPYGAAIASRLVGYCRVVRLTGGDRRLRSAASGAGS